MSLESLIKMQSSGARSIEEANTPRPGGVAQGSVLVTLDVTKELCTPAVYWAMGNVVRRGDNLKILGIITHVSNPMGFKTRVDKNSWIGSNGVMLQHEVETKRDALESIPHVKEWCEKAGVKLDVDVKAGYQIKIIVVEEAKAIGAYHVVLDKNMKSDRKYFVENLTCFVSRARNSGGIDTIRSFSVSKQLPPLVPTPPNTLRNGNQPLVTTGSTASMASLASTHSHHSHGSVSSSSYGESSDGFLTQDSDLFSLAPTTGESLERIHEAQENPTHRASIPFRSNANPDLMKMQKMQYHADQRAPRLSPVEFGTGSNLNNHLTKPTLRKWLAEEESTAEVTAAPFEDSIPYGERNGNGNKIQNGMSSNEQTRRAPTTFLEKSVNAVPSSAQVSHPLQRPPGRAVAQANPPLINFSRMPSPPHSKLTQNLNKTVWVWTRSKDVMRSAVEVGWTSFIFTPDTKYMAPQWTSIEWIKPLFLDGGRFLNQEGKQVALLGQVYSGEQLDYLPAMMGNAETVVINDLDWQLIPPEDVVAAFQGRRTQLFATANTAADAQVYLEALEVGFDGVVLHTENTAEIAALRDYLLEKKLKKDRALEWVNAYQRAEQSGKGVAEETVEELPVEVAELPGLTPEHSLERTDSHITNQDSTLLRSDSKGVNRDSTLLRSDSQGVIQDSNSLRSDSNGVNQDSSPLRSDSKGVNPDSSQLRTDSNCVNQESSSIGSDSNSVGWDTMSLRSDCNPLNRVGSSPRLLESPRAVNVAANQAPNSSTPQTSTGLKMVKATVKSVVSVGEGDRVSVDLCNLLNPGEAVLVGSFTRGMFLVHSEVQANNTSRKSFRVNAGPVHAYTGMVRGHMAYLSELESGGQVLAVDAHGHSRTVLVGRVSIETKPLVLVVAEAGGQCFNVMLEDADSVRLVIPAEDQRPGHESIAVTQLKPGDAVCLRMENDDALEF
ncbi:uncharacterized protein [Physcomitrium patens]|uniref:Uncharacterized protein n=1 Tax=Physcomitrium patens TaxID=3218 RepID=A0A2K1JXA3_PHYPA|nr:uncharacterized protein LOC112287969 [Physcomitrium patens]PNR46167.1 hypothetical protein PHYPA_013286 [Physcomitrium patens]|eukprot:XP_024387445.1 uncharacterized protein LOC112287969 [Physcomitrella patens]